MAQLITIVTPHHMNILVGSPWISCSGGLALSVAKLSSCSSALFLALAAGVWAISGPMSICITP